MFDYILSNHLVNFRCLLLELLAQHREAVAPALLPFRCAPDSCRCDPEPCAEPLLHGNLGDLAWENTPRAARCPSATERLPMTRRFDYIIIGASPAT
ncbi:hypothetical protein ACFSUD_18145 [Sulfitobacter aestuarii]|uniref:Uncharacterized protein n=1 Tax=Sulfitobacter aestuarii TaxID=2161676 RepID=A0ABW5U6Q6_9RHOB